MRRSERITLAALGCAFSVGAAILTPPTARAGAFSAEQPAVEAVPSAATRVTEGTPAPLEIARDPFISQAPQEPAAGSAMPAVPVPAFQFGRAGVTPSPSPSPPALRAIVAGTHPYALVEVNGSVEVVAPGDLLGGSRVIAIDLDGLLLEGGARMTLGAPVK